jgi:protein-L-isoaspartate(D-aspartate) O-methyltransferase
VALIQRTDPASNFNSKRAQMIERQIRKRGILSEPVLNSIKNIPREQFVSSALQEKAYDDCALPIGFDQTISQPYIVAYMTDQLHLSKGDRVLEVGTGSGYQTAVLSNLVSCVYSIETVGELYRQSKDRLKRLGVTNLRQRLGDGTLGWKEEAPFNKMIVTAGLRSIPASFVEQLYEGGMLIAPIGNPNDQKLMLGQKIDGFLKWAELIPVRFVSIQH